MKLAEIAARITVHLERFETDSTINMVNPKTNLRPYYCASVGVSGTRVFVGYVAYQGQSSLKKDEAIKYLEWLDAGNVGKHWTALK